MNDADMQHGQDWDGDQDLTGWQASEKFNGCRAYWDGATLWSRGGIAIQIPETWRAALPAGIALDGEVYDGIDGLTRCVSAVRWGRFTPSHRFMAFDLPEGQGDWLARVAELSRHANIIVRPVWAWINRDADHLREKFAEIQARGGEGLVLRRPGLAYTPGRTDDLLKVKYAFQFQEIA